MPQVQREPRRVNKQTTLIVVGAAAVVSVAALLALWFLTPSVQGAADQAERLNQERKPAEGLALIKSVQWKAWTKGDKLIVLSQLAGTSLALDRDADAIKYYRQMEALQGTTLANDLNLAEIGEKIGDKDLAIKEYQQAIVDLKKLPESDIQQITPEGLQEHIDALQHPEAQP